jgi:uncharacterized Zn finger protein (UPF0148 family)
MVICNSCHCDVENKNTVFIKGQGEIFCMSCFLEWEAEKKLEEEYEKMNMKEAIRKAMRTTIGIVDKQSALEAIEFVTELLEIDIENTEKNEPYATRSIADMRAARSRVQFLTDMIEEELD